MCDSISPRSMLSSMKLYVRSSAQIVSIVDRDRRLVVNQEPDTVEQESRLSPVVTAAFDADLRAFYEGLGFSVRPAGTRGDGVDGAAGDEGDESVGAPADGSPDRLEGRVSVTGRESP